MTIDDLPADRRISGLRLRRRARRVAAPGSGLRRARRRAARRDPVRLRPAEHPPAERARARRRRRRVPHDHHRHLRAAARRGLPREPARLGHGHHAPVRPGRARVAWRSPSGTSRASSTSRWRRRRHPRRCTAPTSRRSTRSPATCPARATPRSGSRCCARPSPRWYTERGTPTSPDQILDHDRRAAGDPPAGHRARRPRRPRGRRAPDLPARDRRRPRASAPGPVPVPSGGAGLDIDLLESTLRQVSPRLVYLIPDHRNPTGTSLDDDERAAGPRPGPAVPHGDRRRRGPDRADHGRTGAQLVRRRRHGVGLRRLDRLGVQELLGRPAGRLGPRAPGPRRAGWPPRARTPTSAPPCWSSWSWPSCSRSRPTSWPRRRTELRARRDLLVGLLLDQLPSWRFDVPAGGLVAVGGPRRARVQRARRDLDPARRPGRARHGVRGGRQLRAEPAAAVHHVTRRPAPSRRRARRGLGGAGHHRAGRRTRPGARAGLTVRSAAACRVGVAWAPSCSRPTACTPWAASVAPVLAEPLLGVVLRREHRADRPVERATRPRRRSATPTAAAPPSRDRLAAGPGRRSASSAASARVIRDAQDGPS